MPASPPAHVASIWRGDALEAVVRGHVAIVGGDRTLLGSAGDPAAVTTLRSCVKPIQALPFVERALDSVGAQPAELAIACASHNGEPEHAAAARRLLARVGLDESALSCGPQLPYDEQSAEQAIRAGRGPQRITNNCSGKHAAMLATCVVAGWPTAGYAAWDHPLQVEIRRIMGDLAGQELDSAPHGIDGCGLPTHGVPLSALAAAFAAGSAVAGFRRCQEAMAAHPEMVAGRRRFDTALLAAAGQSITAKGGGAAVWVAVRRPDGPGLAIKLEAGDAQAMSAVALAVLRSLGWVAPEVADADGLRDYARPALRNWAGDPVGEIRVERAWLSTLTG